MKKIIAIMGFFIMSFIYLGNTSEAKAFEATDCYDRFGVCDRAANAFDECNPNTTYEENHEMFTDCMERAGC